MASINLYRFHKIDDKTLVDIWKAFNHLLQQYNLVNEVEIFHDLKIPLNEVDNSADLVGRYAIDSATLSAVITDKKYMQIKFFRDIQVNKERTPSATYNEIQIILTPNGDAWKGELNLIFEIKKLVDQLNIPAQSVDSDETNALRDLIVGFGSSHRQMLAQLQDSIRSSEQRRLELDEVAEKKEAERREVNKKMLSEVEAERSKLELQSHMAERRRLHQQIISQAAADARKSMAPKGAVRARWAVFFTSIALSGVAGALGYLSINSLTTTEATVQFLLENLPENSDAASVNELVENTLWPRTWYLIGRSILFSGVCIGSLIYAAAWLRSFYNAELQTSQEIDRFNYDISRASWIIETVLEVQHEKKGDVPQEWIEGVTRGLFSGGAGDQSLEDGAQALRALLGFTASASFGPEGPKFEISKRDARRLAKEAKLEGQ